MDDSKRNAISPSISASRKPQKSALSRKTRIGLIVFTLILVVVALEIGLRSVGFSYYFEKNLKPGNHPDDAFVIICLGDSSTQGASAGSDNLTYPAQLETLLNTRHPDRQYRLVNLGCPGANSSQIARRFEGYVRLHKPDMAILLIGNNDVWNRNESRMALVGTGEEARLGDRLAARLRYWADSSRVVRLARALATKIHDPRTSDWNAMAHASPSYDNFRRSLKILGDVERVRDLYRLNFRQISKVAGKYDVDLLWLDYHVGAKFGETQHLSPVLKDLGAASIDLFPLFHNGSHAKGMMKNERDTVRRDLLHDDLWHPNALGYAVFARAIYNQLVEMGHAPGPPIDVMQNLQPHE